MDYRAIQQRVAEMLGLPDDDSEYLDKIKSWINESYHAVSSLETWPWLVENGAIQTVEEITTGTISVTEDSTTITFSSAPTPSVAGWRIKFGSSNDWYNISTHTAAAVGAVLANNYLEATNGTQTYTLRKVYYALPSDFEKLISARQAITRTKLKPVDLRLFDANIPDPRITRTPAFYMIVGQDSSQLYQMAFHPVPDDEMNIDIRYYKRTTDMSANTDVPFMPDPFRPVIVFDVLVKYGYMFIDDSRISQAGQLRNKFLGDMKAHSNPSPDNVVRKLPWDRAQGFITRDKGLQYNLPIEG